MTRHTLFLALALLASGCTTPDDPAASPPPETPTSPERPNAGTNSDLLRCSTAAFAGDEVWPVALRIAFDMEEDNPYMAPMTLGAAQPDQEGVVAAPLASWEEQAYLSIMDDDLVFDGPDLTVRTQRDVRFSAPMYVGTLQHTEHGEHAVACWFDDFEADFRYDPESQICVDADSTWGWNPYPLPYTRDTLDGHCGLFEGVMLNEDFFGYPTWIGMDLRGAQMQGSQLFFANILEAQWEGANLTGMEFGYAFLTGSVDDATTWPEENCELDDDWLDCVR